MHSATLRSEALELVAAGVNDCEVARRLGVPRTTVRDWRAPRYEPRSAVPRAPCPRCWRSATPALLDARDYAFLLGLYLGDGCISRTGRTFRLRIHLDAKYPGIVAETESAMARCFPFSLVGTVAKDGGSCMVVGVYSNHLPCLFPQDGPGKKHDRALALESWQESLVDCEPWWLLRGLIWSDGCSFINRHRCYEDLCYAFANRSTDILRIFSSACDRVGVRYRSYPPRQEGGRVRAGQIRINTRRDVRLMEANVGVKSDFL